MQQLSTNANESLIALLAGGGANSDGGSTRCSTAFCVSDQRVLLNTIDELASDDVASVQQGPVPTETAAAADGGDCVIKEEDKRFGGQCITEHLGGETHILIDSTYAIRLGLQLPTSLVAEARPVNLGDSDGSAHCAAIKAVDD